MQYTIRNIQDVTQLVACWLWVPDAVGSSPTFLILVCSGSCSLFSFGVALNSQSRIGVSVYLLFLITFSFLNKYEVFYI